MLTEIAGIIDDRSALFVDRAVAELRAGRPIIIDAPFEASIVASLDSVSPRLYSVLSSRPGCCVVLSTARAKTVGVETDRPVAIPAGHADRAEALRWATGSSLLAPGSWGAAGATAASGIALAKQAGLLPALVAIELAKDAASLPDELVRISTGDIAKARREAPTLAIVSTGRVPLGDGVPARFVVLRGAASARDQVAIVVGTPDPGQPVLVRAHSACLTGDVFGSRRCDCGDQLRRSLARMAAEGGGVLLYLDQEGRGIGLCNKMRAYALQDEGLDTIEANAMLGFEADERHYDVAAAMLTALGHTRVRLMTNNPDKIERLRAAGIDIVARLPLAGAVNPDNRFYLATKIRRAGHLPCDVAAEPEPFEAPVK